MFFYKLQETHAMKIAEKSRMVNPSGFLKPLFYSSIPHLSFMYSFPNPEPIFSLILRPKQA